MAEIIEDIAYQDPVPKSGGQLSDQHRTKLDSIVTKMIANKESDDNIRSVVNDFKQKYSAAAEQPKQPVEAPVQVGFKPMTDWLKLPEGGYRPIMPDAVVDNSHYKKTNEAAERINRSLAEIDPHIKNILYDAKKDIQGRVKSQELAINPTEAASFNPQAALIESKMREEPAVDPSEVESYKAEMGSNVNMVRNALRRQVYDLSKTNPERANQIKADVYRLDRQENPDKESKISKNVDKIKDGSLDYDVKKGILVKPQGFFGSLATGFKHKNQLFKDYEFYKNTDNEAAIIKELNAKVKETDPDEAVPVPDGSLGEIGAMIGGQPIKPVAGGLIAGALTTPAGGAVGGGAIAGHEMYKLGYAAALPQNYAAIKRENPGMPDYEAYTKAKDLTENQAVTDAVSGGLMSVVGMRLGLKPTGISAAFQRSLRSGLNQIGKVGVEKAAEGLIGGEVGALGQQIKNLMAQKAGLPVDRDEGVIDQLVAGVGMTMGTALFMKFPKLLKPSTFNRLTHEISKMPDDVIAQEIEVLQKSGYVTPEEVQNANKIIKEQRDINNSIRGDVPESDRVKIQEKIKKVNELEKELEASHKAYHPEIKEEIKKLNEEIVNISKGSEKGELQKIVANAEIEGATAEVLKNASEKDLNGYFKEIAEQAHDPNSEKLTIETFGEDIVNKAKELYPKTGRGELQMLMDKEYKGTDPYLINATENELRSTFKAIADMAHDPELARHISFSEKIINKAKELYPKNKIRQDYVEIFSDIEKADSVKGKKARSNALDRISDKYADAKKTADYINENFYDIEKKLLSSKIIEKICP